MSPAVAERVRWTLRLPDFYARHMAPWRAWQVAQGHVRPATTAKDRQAVNRWRAWELEARPEQWPDEEPWRGLPIGYITGGYLDRFFAAMTRTYAADTVDSTRGHLSAILRFAAAVGALTAAPKSSPVQRQSDDTSLDEDLATVWTEPQINALYRALPSLELRTALVLAVNVGPRSGDLFGLAWERNFRLDGTAPKCVYRARKTGKVHGIPLPPVVTAHLDRLRRSRESPQSGAVFSALASPACKDPERSHAARRRNRAVKAAMSAAGLPPHVKPWQVCRATCCTRLNDVRRGVGSWVIGQGTDRAGTRLAAAYYDDPTEEVVAAIMAAPQPSAFLD